MFGKIDVVVLQPIIRRWLGLASRYYIETLLMTGPCACCLFLLSPSPCWNKGRDCNKRAQDQIFVTDLVIQLVLLHFILAKATANQSKPEGRTV